MHIFFFLFHAVWSKAWHWAMGLGVEVGEGEGGGGQGSKELRGIKKNPSKSFQIKTFFLL